MIVTTSPKPSEKVLHQSLRLAQQLSASWQERAKLSVHRLLQRSEDGVVVVTEREVRFYSSELESPYFFHPSMALVRLKRMLQGQVDTLMDYARCTSGDIVVDCTAGLCSDAIVFSHAVGTAGRVIAVESEPIVYTLAKEGLQDYKTGLVEADQAMRRIELMQSDYYRFLQKLDTKSVDIVYFDPMFTVPVQQSNSIEPLRFLANDHPLLLDAVTQAKRVARKTVVMKEHVSSDQFGLLGFNKRLINRTKIAYGVIEIDTSK
ncbi:class I SAM-dependent methyltransferase [Paenibacillus yanchengensis]|uniref:Class I SAM-dependent methyltransferase n=1 Tax=Paenibacillus yanchengensis TaxID=2035833 RepID=A0ABW4YJC4_9BACL